MKMTIDQTMCSELEVTVRPESEPQVRCKELLAALAREQNRALLHMKYAAAIDAYADAHGWKCYSEAIKNAAEIVRELEKEGAANAALCDGSGQ